MSGVRLDCRSTCQKKEKVFYYTAKNHFNCIECKLPVIWVEVRGSDTADDSSRKVVKVRVDCDIQRNHDWRMTTLFDNLDLDMDVRVEGRRAIVKHPNLKAQCNSSIIETFL